MSELNRPAAPDSGPVELPTPSLDASALPEGSDAPPAQPPSPTSADAPQSGMRVCPIGYRRATVENGQSFADLLLENNVSYQALRDANLDPSVDPPAAGTIYCAPPSGTRRLCSGEGRSYIMAQGESLSSLAASLGISAGRLLAANPFLAPDDFVPGRVICLP